ncbi:hypothetical protein [Pedobacter borealis]|uniref:hypothetical protein n=1 Tax=Pedobacter borealis TaxID=475254 RepID=UPI0004930A19|nr:hypothetical protein [Pedobacter borealis]
MSLYDDGIEIPTHLVENFIVIANEVILLTQFMHVLPKIFFRQIFMVCSERKSFFAISAVVSQFIKLDISSSSQLADKSGFLSASKVFYCI